MKEIHCARGDYTTIIGGPYGLPEGLVDRCMADHEAARKGHKYTVR
ncbi:MAG TPA: hypothetical protein VKG61_25265 [Streptosporangiaceae bacterium]|nr:hypothetical protein [Streptosporangiaceae bacterium]